MELLEHIIDLDIKVRMGGVVHRWWDFTIVGVSFLEGILENTSSSPSSSTCRKASFLHFWIIVSSFTFSHQLGCSLI